MMVYRFLSAKRGLEALRDRRLKLSLINELNDPFEFLAVNLREKVIRRAFAAMKARLSETMGILCFSTKWSNPVLWSHYADRHSGLCLGFDVRNELLDPVEYAAERIAPDEDWLSAAQAGRVDVMRKLLRTKFEHWRYESEVRMFARLEEIDAQVGLYFKPFYPDLALTHVIVGATCTLGYQEVSAAVVDENIELIKARAAFKSFNIVPDRRGLKRKQVLSAFGS